MLDVPWTRRASPVALRILQWSAELRQPLIPKLERRDHTLSAAEKAVLEQMSSRLTTFGPGEDMVCEGDRPTNSTLLLEGWASRYVTLADGRRQILALHISGDFVDLHSFPLKLMDHSVGAITACKVALVPHAVLEEITQSQPHLTRLLWLSTLIDAAILRQWLVGAGQRSAEENLAHRFCELYSRLQVTGLAGEGRFELPLTQEELGDTVGISAVHTNRVLQQLKGRGLVTWRNRVVTIENWTGLAELAGFDPTYLNLTDEPR